VSGFVPLTVLKNLLRANTNQPPHFSGEFN
jgi:hypothetical protein